MWQLLHACLAPHSLLTGSTCVKKTGPDTLHALSEVHILQALNACFATRHRQTHVHKHTLTNPLALVAQQECGGLVWLY